MFKKAKIEIKIGDDDEYKVGLIQLMLEGKEKLQHLLTNSDEYSKTLEKKKEYNELVIDVFEEGVEYIIHDGEKEKSLDRTAIEMMICTFGTVNMIKLFIPLLSLGELKKKNKEK